MLWIIPVDCSFFSPAFNLYLVSFLMTYFKILIMPLSFLKVSEHLTLTLSLWSLFLILTINHFTLIFLTSSPNDLVSIPLWLHTLRETTRLYQIAIMATSSIPTSSRSQSPMYSTSTILQKLYFLDLTTFSLYFYPPHHMFTLLRIHSCITLPSHQFYKIKFDKVKTDPANILEKNTHFTQWCHF